MWSCAGGSSAASAAGVEEGPAGAATATAADADVEVDAGRYDVTTHISPALAAALEAAPEGAEDVVEGVVQQLNDAVERLERGQGGCCRLLPAAWRGRLGAPGLGMGVKGALLGGCAPALAGSVEAAAWQPSTGSPTTPAYGASAAAAAA